MRLISMSLACLFFACTPSEKDTGADEAQPNAEQSNPSDDLGGVDPHADHAGPRDTHAGADEHVGHAGETNQAHQGHNQGSAHGGHEGHGSMPAAEVPGTSIYQLESTWTKASGGTMQLSELAGSPVVVLMFYATCQSACPMLISDVKSVETSLSDGARAETQYVLVTFDPENDTPEVLNELRSMYELSDKYTLLHGSDSDVRELAAVLGIQYRARSNGHFTHTNLITLLDREGVVAERVEGLRQPNEPIVEAVEAMSDER